jgi:hypothetical protein
MITKQELAVITFNHLIAFIAKAELGYGYLDTLRLRDLLSAAIVSERDDPANKLLIAALEFVRSSQED